MQRERGKGTYMLCVLNKTTRKEDDCVVVVTAEDDAMARGRFQDERLRGVDFHLSLSRTWLSCLWSARDSNHVISKRKKDYGKVVSNVCKVSPWIT